MLEFGRQRKLLAYILAANVITRRLHDLWIKKTEQYWNTKDEADRPRPLMITIEEAHKFLNAERRGRRPSAPSPASCASST